MQLWLQLYWMSSSFHQKLILRYKRLWPSPLYLALMIPIALQHLPQQYCP